MLDIVEKNKRRYRAAGKTRKTEIVKEVTEEIRANGARFLKRSDSSWRVVSPLETHKKVCHCLREEKSGGSSGADAISSSEDSSNSGDGNDVKVAKAYKRKARLLKGKKSIFNAPSATASSKVPKNAVVDACSETDKKRRRKKLLPMNTRKLNSTPSEPEDKNAPRQHRNFTSEEPLQKERKKQSATATQQQEGSTTGRGGRGGQGVATLGFGHNEVDAHSRKQEQASSMAALPDTTLSSTIMQGASFQDSSLAYTSDIERLRYLQHSMGLAALTTNSPAAVVLPPGTVAREDVGFGMIMGEPHPGDVLFGIDPNFELHPGNMQLRSMIQASVGIHPSTTEQKLMISKGILARLRMGGSRFLTRQSMGPRSIWYQMTEVEVEVIIFRRLCDEELALHAVVHRSANPAIFGMPNLPQMQRSVAPPGFLPFSATESLSANMSGSNMRLKEPATRPSVAGKSNRALSGDGDDEESVDIPLASLKKKSKSAEKTKRKLTRASEDRTTRFSNSKRSFNATALSSDRNLSPTTSFASSDEQTLISVSQPTDTDILLGRGRGNFRHPSNRRLLRIFQEQNQRYRGAKKSEKSDIAKEIVRDIQRQGGRFLKRGDNGISWYVVKDREAFRKVCHGIRDIPKSDGDSPEIVAHPHKKRKTEEPVDTRASMTMVRNSNISADQSAMLSMNFKIPNPQPPSNAVQQGHGIVAVQPKDIICGRGKGVFSHPGNRRMLNIIHENKARYKRSTKSEKGVIAREIMAEVQGNGGRFLRRKEEDPSKWEILDYKEALIKVCHSIRDSLANNEEK